jgi:hypothetical protein
MLEGGRGGQVQHLLQFPDQLPGIEGVEQVDIAWGAVQDLDGQLAFGHIDARRNLVRVAAIAQFKLICHGRFAFLVRGKALQVGCDGSVIMGSVSKAFDCQTLARGEGNFTLTQLS